MIKVKLITYYEGYEKYEEVITLKEFQDRYNTIRHNDLSMVDKIEFIVE